MKLRPHGLTAELLTLRIRSLVRSRRLRTGDRFSALPLGGTRDANPKVISRRTSYHPVRLEFLFDPQLIPTFCSMYGFGPPVAFTQRSSWPRVAHSGFGSSTCDLKEIFSIQYCYRILNITLYGLLILAFTTISCLLTLN